MAKLKLEGTRARPYLALTTNWGEKLPGNWMKTVAEWAKALPSRRWDPDRAAWIIDGLGPNPDMVIEKSGFEVDTSAFPADFDTFAELAEPWIRLDTDRPGYAKIAPRLTGKTVMLEMLGPAAIWDTTHERVSIPLLDLLAADGDPRPEFNYPDDVWDAILDAAEDAAQGAGNAAAAHVTHAALAPDLKDAASRAALDKLVDELGNLEGFGVDLYEYQRLGAYAVASGRGLLADVPGLGKTFQSLAALTLTGCERMVLVVPPVVLTNWRREYLTAGTLPGEPVVIISGRKEPELPDRGAVIVSDSLLASRPALLQKLMAWQPDGLVYDEAHRAKTWEAKRSVVVRTLAESLGDRPRIVLTGTPQTKSPAEIASMLAVSGQLQRVFGGYNTFVEKFCRKDHFGNLLPRKKALPELRRILDEQVWVRRYKSDVLPDLPPKQWHTLDVDVPLKGYREAHAEVLETVEEWVDKVTAAKGRYPIEIEVEEYAQGNLAVVSPMRKAAGLAKVDTAADWILNWVDARDGADDENVAADGGVASPLLVWCHHRDVMKELQTRIEAELDCEVPIISGETSLKQKTRMVDGFQAGDFPVMICQIFAAGVGITLTRSTDAVFVETDWTDALVSQAEDRNHRIGQNAASVTYTTLLAVDTLDEFIHKVRLAKKDTSDVVVGRAGGEAADQTQRGRDLMSPSDLITQLVDEVLRKKTRDAKKNKKRKVLVGAAA